MQQVMFGPRSRSFDAYLEKKLQDREMAVAYLREHLVDDGKGDYKELLLLALRNIARAYGCSTKPARDGYIVNAAEKRALQALRMLQRDDILEYADSIATGRADNRGREQRLLGLLTNLANARAALE